MLMSLYQETLVIHSMIIVSHRHCTGLKMQIVIKNVQRDLALALTISLFCVVTIKYLDITNAFHFILETKQQHSHYTVCESQDALKTVVVSLDKLETK